MKIFINTKNILRLVVVEKDKEKIIEVLFSTIFGEFAKRYKCNEKEDPLLSEDPLKALDFGTDLLKSNAWEYDYRIINKQVGFIEVDGIVEQKLSTIK